MRRRQGSLPHGLSNSLVALTSEAEGEEGARFRQIPVRPMAFGLRSARSGDLRPVQYLEGGRSLHHLLGSGQVSTGRRARIRPGVESHLNSRCAWTSRRTLSRSTSVTWAPARRRVAATGRACSRSWRSKCGRKLRRNHRPGSPALVARMTQVSATSTKWIATCRVRPVDDHRGVGCQSSAAAPLTTQPRRPAW